ncbi:MAG: hypothetical protein ABIK68_19470 [bacterium]
MRADNQPQPKKWILPALVIGLAGLMLTIAHFYREEGTQPLQVKDIPVVMGHREGCFLCHQEMTGLSPSHDPLAIGCSSCHQGNPLSADKEMAHQGVVTVPGNMETVMATCGQSDCHRDLAAKVTGSLMATGQGMVSVNRYVFGETQSPDGPGHLSHLSASAADTHLRQLCVTCHLGFPKTASAAIDEKSRGGGCTACHIDYSADARQQMADYHQSRELPRLHPALNIKVGNERCFGCHSRSARISLNYEGWHETLLKPKEAKQLEKFRILQDRRVLTFQGADVHHEKGMLCLDCHSARDAMGDGTGYNHQGEQVEIACIDCHRQDQGRFVTYGDLDADSIKILQLRNVENRKSTEYLAAHRTGRPLINLTRGPDGAVRYQGKLDHQSRELKPPAEACTAIREHDRLTCQTCHTRWAPTCVECHTQYLPDKQRKDHYTGEKVQGVWREYKEEFLALPPVMGVRMDKRLKREVVDTFIPGMILTIGGISDNRPDSNAPPEKDPDRYQVFRRMFAPTFSHTVQTESRSCQSCHQDPRVLGLGEGRIEYGTVTDRTGEIPMQFTPESRRHPADGLPRDAWTSFLETKTRDTATRTGSRPFNRAEQQQILRVGQCLLCHLPDPGNSARIYTRFAQALEERTSQCLQTRKPTR